MTLREYLDRFVFVYRCVGCGEVLSFEESRSAFCPKCRLLWEEAKSESCSECFREAVACTCMPKKLSKSGALCLRKLIFYHAKKEHTPPNRLLYRLKHQPNDRLERFVARELAIRIREELRVLSIDNPSSQVVLTYAPRSRQAVRVEGFDQSRRMVRALSRELSVPCVTAFARTRRTDVQKKLSADARMQNARKSFRCIAPNEVDGKYVILFDDVVTTGASMGECVFLLRRAGTKGVLCFCIAMD